MIKIISHYSMDDCLQKEYAVKWCLALNPDKKRCEPLIRDLSSCYAKILT